MSDCLAAAYLASGLAGVACLIAAAAAFVAPYLAGLGSFAVPGLVIAALLTATFKLGALAGLRAEKRHG